MIHKGSILENVMDIDGYTHQKAEVLGVYEYTMSIVDMDLDTTHIVHKLDVGLTVPLCKTNFTHFDLKGNQRLKKPKKINAKTKRWAF